MQCNIIKIKAPYQEFMGKKPKRKTFMKKKNNNNKNNDANNKQINETIKTNTN